MDNKPIYCGIGKKITTKYGDLLKLSLTKDDLETLQKNLNNGWVNLVVKERKEPSEKGTTHYLVLDTWQPEKKGGTLNDKAQEVTVEDLPF